MHGASASAARPVEGGAKQPPAQISAKFVGAGTKVHRKTAKEQAEDLEARDGGHSLDRHGPQVDDKQLQDRITTGVAPDGNFAPTSVSTKFASHEMYMEARLKSEAKLDGAIVQVQNRMRPFLLALNTADNEHATAKAGPDKGPTGKLGKALADAKNAITVAAAAPAAGEVPVSVTKGAKPQVLHAAKYSVVVVHGKPIGSGFEGTGGAKTLHDPTPGSTKTGEGHNATKALPAVTKSKATFETGAPRPELLAAPPARLRSESRPTLSHD